MKKQKKNLFVVGVMALVGITSISIGSTYAKYISSASATGNVSVAKWAVKVNNTDITPAGTTSVGNVVLTTVNSSYVVNGKVAPQSEAYGVFTIDPTGAEVAMGYKFDLGTIAATLGTCTGGTSDGLHVDESTCTTGSGTWVADTVPTGLAVSGVKYCTGSTCTAAGAGTWVDISKEASGTDSGKYLGSIALPSATSAMTASEKVMVKVTVKWSDDETTGATVQDATDDVNHTAAGIAATTLNVPVTVTVYQKVS